MTKSTKYHTAIGLIRWSILRHKFYIPVFMLVQILLALAIIYGFSFVTNSVDTVSQSYLYTGAITINLIAVSCVLAPQIVSEAKQNGIYAYQKTLPISRLGILLADLFLWSLMSLPGLWASMIIGSLKFKIPIQVNFLAIFSLLLITGSLTLFGFAIAYLFPPNIMALTKQLSSG